MRLSKCCTVSSGLQCTAKREGDRTQSEREKRRCAMADPGPDGRKELDWDLHISVPTQGVKKSVRVTSDESVGALMIKIAEKLGWSLSLSLSLSLSCKIPSFLWLLDLT